MRSFFILIFSIFCWAMPASADDVVMPDEISLHMMTPRLVGRGSYRWLWFDAYHASLWAPAGRFSPSRPYALQLIYRFNASGESIARKSIEEMNKQIEVPDHQKQIWMDEMVKAFPNITDGDRIVGVAIPSQGISYFYHNGRMMHGINDKVFLQRFFNIWLGEKTSNPELRRALLGL